MPEWIHDGVEATRTSDALLDEISRLLMENKALRLELAQYRVIVPEGSTDPAHV